MSTLTNPVLNSIDSVGVRNRFATSYNFRVCENCGHDLREQMPEIGAQLWGCLDCGMARQWGFLRPEDRDAKPMLQCDGCRCPTRHAFLGVAGRIA